MIHMTIYDANDTVLGYIDEQGAVYDQNHNKVGSVNSYNQVFDKGNRKVGSINPYSQIFNSGNHKIGSVNYYGQIFDSRNHIVGWAKPGSPRLNKNNRSADPLHLSFLQKITAVLLLRRNKVGAALLLLL